MTENNEVLIVQIIFKEAKIKNCGFWPFSHIVLIDDLLIDAHYSLYFKLQLKFQNKEQKDTIQ